MLALDELESSFRVKHALKPKSLAKFGKTSNADSGVRTTVATFQADTVVNETFATGNTIDSVIGDNASDAGKTVTIEGHTVDGSGNLTFVVQTAVLGNQTRTALTTPLYRATRIFTTKGTFASPATAMVGHVYVYDNTLGAGGATSGTPNEPTATKVMLDAGEQQSEKCATSISSADAWIITRVASGLSRGGGATVNADIDVEVRQQGGVWRPLGLELALRTASLPFKSIELKPYRIVPPNSDVRLIGVSDTANTTLQGSISGWLALQRG